MFDWSSIDGLDVIRYDARGHGRSPAGADSSAYEWSTLGDDFLVVADSVGAESFVAGGASMGCATVLFAALAAPERVQALVLAIPPTAWETRAAQSDTYLASAGYVEAKGMAAFVEASRQLPAQPAWTADGREARLALLAELDGDVLATVLRGAAASNLPPRDSVATISCPTLILAWADDPGHPLSTAESLSSLIAGSSLEVARSKDEVLAWPSLVSSFVAAL
jgi:pimeloyl-ACP methyl ester carboxylesterase